MSDYKPDAYIKLGVDVFERWIEKLRQADPQKLKQMAEMMQTMVNMAKKTNKGGTANIG